LKEKREEKGGEKGVDIIELKEDDDILMGFKGTNEVYQKKEEKKAKEEKLEIETKVENEEDESLNNLSIDEEINFLFKLLPDNYRNINIKNLFYSTSNNLILRRNNEYLKKKFISHKIYRKKENQEIEFSNLGNKKKKKKKITKSYSRTELLEKLLRINISIEKWNYYFDLYRKSLLRY
jgi:hypothetical protein